MKGGGPAGRTLNGSASSETDAQVTCKSRELTRLEFIYSVKKTIRKNAGSLVYLVSVASSHVCV